MCESNITASKCVVTMADLQLVIMIQRKKKHLFDYFLFYMKCTETFSDVFYSDLT